MILFILFIIIKVTTINNNKLKLKSSKLSSYNTTMLYLVSIHDT